MEFTENQSLVLRRRSSLFKDVFGDREFLEKFLLCYLASYKEKHPALYDAPITWERISTGYRIVDFQMGRYVDALELLQMNYFCTDKICAASSLYLDSKTMNKYQQYFLDIASADHSFCAIEEGTGELAGVAMANIVSEDFDEYECDNSVCYVFQTQEPCDLMMFEKSLLEEANISEKYQVDKYFCIHLICVKSGYHGKGIGTSLVRTCLSKAQKIQCSVCIGIFPAGSSLTVARKFDFESLSEKPWRNVKIIKSANQRPVMDFSKFEESFVACMGVVLPLLKTEENEIENENEGIN